MVDPVESSTSKNDFVIRDGFPALRKTDDGEPWIEGDEPIPRFPVWAHDDALRYSHIDQIRKDCATVFSARTRNDHEAYSHGLTFFVPSQMKPRCALEAMALAIFNAHTKHLEPGVMIPEQSGAEWWSLVLDEDENNLSRGIGDDDEDESDEVGMHFDADYGLEDQAPGLLLHPRVATVTYLSDFGAPTVVLNVRSPPPGDEGKRTLEAPISKLWVSHPQIGKHLAFDGRLLHGAPATFFPARQSKPDEERPVKKSKEDRTRVTFLVNIWVNHCPLDAEPLDDDICKDLVTPFSEKVDLAFQWQDPDLSQATVFHKSTISNRSDDPAGEEEIVICKRLVSIHYNDSMEKLHSESGKSGLVEVDVGDNAIVVKVGDEVDSSDDDDDGSNGGDE